MCKNYSGLMLVLARVTASLINEDRSPRMADPYHVVWPRQVWSVADHEPRSQSLPSHNI